MPIAHRLTPNASNVVEAGKEMNPDMAISRSAAAKPPQADEGRSRTRPLPERVKYQENAGKQGQQKGANLHLFAPAARADDARAAWHDEGKFLRLHRLLD